MENINVDGTRERTRAGAFRWILLWICIASANIGIAQKLPIPNPAVKVELQSTVLNESREIWISTPAEYDLSEKTYPVLFLMDARWHFNHTLGTAEFLHNVQQAPPMIIVGVVSYNRSKDMLPDGLSSEADKFGQNIGGADEFLEFIDKEVGAYLDEHYRVSPYRMLFGHSLGGITAVHALKTRPESFDLYHAFSPSLFYLGDEYLEDWVESVAANPRSAQALFISAGSEEQQLADYIGDALLTPLKSKLPKDSSLGINIVPGDHSSMVHGATANSLGRHFSDWTMRAALEAHQSGGYSGLREHLAGVRQRYPFDTDGVLNRKMFRVAEHTFLNEGIAPAMDLLTRFTNDFPELVSPLIYEALGQGYVILGQHDRVVDIMKKVYKMNPGSELAVSILSQADNSADVALPPDPLPLSELSQYVGTYALEGNPVLEIFVRDGALWGRSQGPVPDRLRWLGDNDFYALGTDRIHYQFISDASAKVVGVRRDSALGSIVAKKR